MNTSSPHVQRPFDFHKSMIGTAARTLWIAVRIFLVGALTLLEPAVRYILSIAMILGIFASVMFEISATGPRFPFLAMLALSLGFGVVLFLYYGLIALLSR